jgi:hypothetical protein
MTQGRIRALTSFIDHRLGRPLCRSSSCSPFHTAGDPDHHAVALMHAAMTSPRVMAASRRRVNSRGQTPQIRELRRQYTLLQQLFCILS